MRRSSSPAANHAWIFALDTFASANLRYSGGIPSMYNEAHLGIFADFLKKKNGGKLAYAQIYAREGSNSKIGPWTEVKPHMSAKPE